MKCWCGKPATYKVPVDPAVTNPNTRLTDGSPGVVVCPDHMDRDGYEPVTQVTGRQFLSRMLECPVCEMPVHDGDHEALYTVDEDDVEQWIMTGHRSCIRAEVVRRNA